MNFEPFQLNWAWDDHTEKWLETKCKGKTILNFPCGNSKIGIRADLDPNVKPDIICDLMHPPFRPYCIDILISDAPFSYFNRFKWILNLSLIPKEKLILSIPPINIHLKHFKRKIYCTTRKNARMLRHFIFFTRKQHTLDYLSK